MKEAFRLLNKSIIRVETPDIDFEEELVNGEGWRVGGGEVVGVGTGMERRVEVGGLRGNCTIPSLLITVDFVMCR